MTPQCCISYTTDTGYLFPTFVSALLARRHAPADVADVAIFSINGVAELDRLFRRASESEGILFISVPERAIEGASAMLARLFLDRIAPPDYGHLLYIDGDTQITGSLAPLLATEVPAGQFCAVSDPMTFSLNGPSRHDRELVRHFASLGFDGAQQRNYFNSGVLRINREGWDEIGQASWKLFQKLRVAARYPDQDALNLVAMDRRIPISLTWNFPIFLRNARLQSTIEPRIVHYMGSPKPWHGAFQPWGPVAYRVYLEAVARYPELAPFLTRMPWRRRLRYRVQQYYKRLHENSVWGHGPRHREILNYEKSLRNVACAEAVAAEVGVSNPLRLA